jgi:diguanylate cyclase
MLFRWGGDEFLLLMFKLPDTEMSRRMQTLNDVLRENAAQWTAAPVTVSVSFGVSGFASLTHLGQAIEEADKAMYENRQRGRKLEKLRST